MGHTVTASFLAVPLIDLPFTSVSFVCLIILITIFIMTHEETPFLIIRHLSFVIIHGHLLKVQPHK